jgi:DICT domain-containing protein
MNEYLMNVMAKQRIYDAIREAATARIAERARQADSGQRGVVSRLRDLLQRARRALLAYPAGVPASWRDTSRA